MLGSKEKGFLISNSGEGLGWREVVNCPGAV